MAFDGIRIKAELDDLVLYICSMNHTHTTHAHASQGYECTHVHTQSHTCIYTHSQLLTADANNIDPMHVHPSTHTHAHTHTHTLTHLHPHTASC